MEGFFKQSEVKNKHTSIMADRLAHAISSNGLRQKKQDSSKLIPVLADLSSKYGEDTVQSAVDWYCSNYGSTYAPQVRNARQFQYKFKQILRAIQRNRPIDALPQKISESAKHIQSNLGILWPSIELQEQEIVLIQKCIHEYESIRNKIAKCHEVDPPLVKYLLSQGSQSRYFVSTWIEQVCKIVWRIWEDDSWSGSSLMPFAISLSNPRFNNIMRDKTREYCFDVSRWERLKLEIEKE